MPTIMIVRLRHTSELFSAGGKMGDHGKESSRRCDTSEADKEKT